MLDKKIRAASLGAYVLLAGFRKDAPAVIAAADVFVLPSRAEPFGLVLLEAMALSKATSATGRPGSIGRARIWSIRRSAGCRRKAWRIQSFEPEQLGNSAITGPLADPDGVGVFWLAHRVLVRDEAGRQSVSRETLSSSAYAPARKENFRPVRHA